MKTLCSKALLSAVTLVFSFAANAASLTFDFSTSFGSVPADGPAPWLTAVFDDGGTPGSVDLSLSVAGTAGAADITEVYLNLAPALDATLLTFTRTGGTGPTAISVDLGEDDYKADGDGLYDILIDLPPPPGQQAQRFNAGETLQFSITGIGSLTAGDFNFFSTPAGGTGPFLAAAKVQDTGLGGEGSDWIGVVPVPAAAWLFASALGVLGWVRRRVA